uniref:Uncharacterized protein n=1 Tax=Setaria digitata TaxID=48799 RepID=A0A915PPE9_9BILA
MSTSDRPLMLTRSITYQQKQSSSTAKLSITTNSNPTSGLLPLSSSSPISAAIVTTGSDRVKFQKPIRKFIDAIVAAFTVS